MPALIAFLFIAFVVISLLGGGNFDQGLIVFWHLIETTIIISVGYYAFTERKKIERWIESVVRAYYFTFHPHPAEPLVRAAITSSSVVDGKALAAALSEVPPGNSLFRSVRLAQAEHLFGQMQAVSARRLRELEAHARAEYERAAIYSVQEAVALAAVALERAKALYRASRMQGRSSI